MTSLDLKTKLLPVAIPVTSVSGVFWIEPWLTLRRDAGLVARDDMPLLSLPLEAGGWSKIPMSAAHAGNWLRNLVLCEPDQNIGTHSAKVTLLSWAAKFGLSHGDRRLLGYHSNANERSMLTYSRDAMARPLCELVRVLCAVREESFRPDSTRSGYFVGLDGCEHLLEDTDDSSSSSEGSADEEDPQHSAEEDACDHMLRPWVEQARDRCSFVRHTFSRCLRIVRPG